MLAAADAHLTQRLRALCGSFNEGMPAGGGPRRHLVERELIIQCINEDAVYHLKAADAKAVSDCRDCRRRYHSGASRFLAADPAVAFLSAAVVPHAAVHTEERFARTCRDPGPPAHGPIAVFARLTCQRAVLLHHCSAA